MEKTYDIAVIGGGIAGYSAALTLNSLRASYIWLGQEGFGEKLASAEYVRNYPAVYGNGQDFVRALNAQKEKEGVSLTPAQVSGVYAMDGGFMIATSVGDYSVKAVILATGVELKGNLAREEEFLGRGVSYCAVCDGALYRGKRIAVVLSSAAFIEEADFLASLAKEAYLVCDSPLNLARKNVKYIRETPFAVEGEGRVKKLRFQEWDLQVDGVFLLRNATPPSALVGGLETEGAHVKVNRSLQTNLQGLFAAGDVTGTPYQYVKAAGEGSVSAFSAVSYVKSLKERGGV